MQVSQTVKYLLVFILFDYCGVHHFRIVKLYRLNFRSVPQSTHYANVLRILRYVKGTLFHGLHFFSH